jgi:SHS2 domain-containing protein
MKRFEFLEHTADIKFQAFGNTLEEAFKNSALAMTKAMTDDKVKSKITKKIKTQGRDNENLLYEFLEDVLVLVDSENFIVAEIKTIKIKNNEITAEVSGDTADKYDIKNHIKSVTYNEMFVKKEKDKYITQVVVDV